MKTIKLSPRKGRWAKSQKWKITSIRIPFEVAQGVEKRAIANGLRSATDAIIQVLAGFVAGTPAPRKKIKLKWAAKPDASARKQYAQKPAKAVKKAAKKAVRKVKTVAKRAATAITDPKRAAKNKADRERRAKIKASAEHAKAVREAAASAEAGGPAPAAAETVTEARDSSQDVTNSDASNGSASEAPTAPADVAGLVG